MRLTFVLLSATLAFAPPVEGGAEPPQPVESAQPSPEANEAAADDDVLGELVVEAKRRGALVLPKIAVVRPADGEPTLLHEVLARDLGLSGEFDVIDVARTMKFDDPFDAPAFEDLGLEAVITASMQAREDGEVEMIVRLFLPAVGDLPAWSRTTVVGASERRLAGHRLSDGVIGALTGTDGPFASRLVLVRTEGSTRHAYLVDADGRGLTRLSPDEHLVVTAALDRDARPYWVASKQNGRYRLYGADSPVAIAVEPAGSIYGLAFAPNGVDVAVSIANGPEIQLFRGELGGGPLDVQTKLEFALTPTFAADGRLVYAGTLGKRRSIYVGAKAVSPREIGASSPTVCDHPDGPLLIYAAGTDKNTDLLSSRLDGTDLARLTQTGGRNYAPACSPDGRLVAFFSTRKGGAGPGLYLMRVDGRRPKRINTAVGDVLMWARIPARAQSPASAPAKTD